MSSATRTLTYLYGDLGSASLTTNISARSCAGYGEVRWSSGAGMPTDFTFAGQRAGSGPFLCPSGIPANVEVAEGLAIRMTRQTALGLARHPLMRSVTIAP
jgi:hypothetical protein